MLIFGVSNYLKLFNVFLMGNAHQVRESELLDSEEHYSLSLGRTAAAAGQVHLNVTCDMCNVCPIRGPCYRCVDCPDFDLCARQGK